MKDLNKKILFCAAFTAVLSVPITVLANSSWYWFGNIRPIYILPILAVITIIVETAIINHMGAVNKPWKTVLTVSVANLLSFALPNIVNMWVITPPYSFDQIIENTPSYTVTVIFLLMTLFAETPIVYLTLRKSCSGRKNLIFSIILSNGLTTLFAAVIERIICRGTYI